MTFWVMLVLAAPAHARYAHIVFDAHTGKVLDEQAQHEPRKPASLTKMMTAYLTFEAVSSGKLKWDQKLRISKRAARQPPSKLGLNPGDTITVQNALLSIITRSANDMAVVLAESVSGSEAKFAEQMTAKAKKLGMTRTTFKNASGLPARGQTTTARDMGVLGQALIRDYPDYYKMFNTESFVYRGQTISNHNHLLGNYPGLDGIKTGYIRASGFNLVASAERSGQRLVGVVMGGRSAPWRDRQMQKLLDANFDKLGVGKAYAAYPVPKGLVPTTHTVSDQEDIPDALEKEDYTAGDDDTTAKEQVAVIQPSGDGSSVAEQLAQITEPAPQPAANTVASIAPAAPQISDDIVSGNYWALQVGAFKTKQLAQSAAARAKRSTAHLKIADISVSSMARGKKRLYRARLNGLSQQEAANACADLKKRKWDCTIIPPEKLAS